MILVSEIISQSKQSNLESGADSKSSETKQETTEEHLTSIHISNRNTNDDFHSTSTEKTLTSLESLGDNS